MQHKGLLEAATHAVDRLLVEATAQRGGHHRLGFATSKERDTVGSRNDANVRCDLSDVTRATTVNALVARHHALAHDLGTEIVKDVLRVPGQALQTIGSAFVVSERLNLDRRLGIFVDVFLDDLFLDHLHALGSRELLFDLIRLAQARFGLAANLGGQCRKIFGSCGNDLLDANLGFEVFDGVNDRKQRFVTKLEGRKHFGFRHLLGATFNHHDRAAMTGDNEFDVAVGQLLGCGVDDQLAINTCNPNGSDWIVERDLRNAECRRCADEGEDVDGAVRVRGQHSGGHHRVVVVAVFKERANGAVDEARVQNFAIAQATFTLEEAAGNLPCCSELLHDINSQWEEVDARARLRVNGGDEHHGVTLGHENCTGRLLCNTSGFDCKRAPTEFDGHRGFFKPTRH